MALFPVPGFQGRSLSSRGPWARPPGQALGASSVTPGGRDSGNDENDERVLQR